MSAYALVINGLQIAMTVLIVIILLFKPFDMLSDSIVRIIGFVAAALVIWGAVVDMREAIEARKTLAQVQDMESSINNIENLNYTLRAQRHDFLNHLQVVYSLIEMEEYEEANQYIDKVYGSIAKVSRALKTKNAAVNALLQVKLAQMEQQGIACEVTIESGWEALPMQGWEMCRVLSNLIDNAIDAVLETPERKVQIKLGESVKKYTFSVSNTGREVPAKLRQTIFMPGVTTKSEGHGMGLYIVRKTLATYGGEIVLESDNNQTTFSGFVPREMPNVTTNEQ